MDHRLTALALVGDLVCPEHCASCATLVRAGALFCHACRASVNVLGPPECNACGAPQPHVESCPACTTLPDSAIRRARAWAAYDGAGEQRPVAHALAAFKYHGAWRLGRRLAAAMLGRVPHDPGSLVAPIPLHPRQLRRRGFNQSAILARHLARALGQSVALRLLVRVRDTPSQTALTAPARAANVADAFAVPGPAAVQNRTVLLVDDVWTSGATARAAARALRAAGARAVDVVTFARVL